MSYTVTFEQALKTHDMSHTTPVGQIDAYIGTDYILLRGANPSVRKVADNHYSMADNGGIVDFPISIQGVTSIEFDLKGTYNTDGQFSKIINNALSGISGTSFNNYTVNWQHKTISLSEPTDIDYLEIYAGGGRGLSCEFKDMTFTCEGTKVTSNGGGATHIAKRTGQLKDLSSYTSDILMVSGGGGGGYLVGEDAYAGADAGGISGSGNNSGNQSSGYAFGQGESGTNESGGGSGLYGGTKNGTSSTIIMNSWCKTTDYNNHRQSSHRHNFTVNFNTDVVSELSSYLGSDYILEYLGDNPSGGMYSQVPITYDGDNNVFYSSVYNKHIALPIKSGIGKIVKLAFSYTNKSSGYYAWIQVGLLKINGSTTTTLKYAQYNSTGNYELTLDTPTEADYLWICNAEDLFEISNMTMYVQASIMNEAGAGSGYIGNSLVSNKKMIGYNIPTSDAEGTKTESVNDVSASAVSGKPKSGNGFARIKYLSDGIIRFKNAIVFPNDNYEVKGKNTENIYTIGQLKQTFSGNNTWFLIWDTNGYIALQFNASSSWNMKLASGKYIVEGDEREDWLWGMNNAADPLYPCYLNGSYIGQSWSLEAKTIGNDTYRNDCYTGGTEEHPCIIVSTITGLEVYKDGVKVMVR